jgi:hypothetical protein
MNFRSALRSASAAKVVAVTFGFLGGLGGIVHGVGETLQGNVAPSGIFFNSWTQGPIATNMGGEPGITIVPSLLITGTLTIIASLALIVWSVAFVQRKNGGRVQILLSVAMLLVGGGIGPPVIGILAGIAGSGIRAQHMWSRKHLSAGTSRVLARSWPWIFGVCLVNGVFLVVGSFILVYAVGLNTPSLFVGSFFLAVVVLVLTIFTGVAHDIQGPPLRSDQPSRSREGKALASS